MKEVTQILLDHSSAIQLVLFCTIMISMWFVEHIGFGGSFRQKWRHTSTNALFIFSALPIQMAMMLLCAEVSSWCFERHWGLLNLMPASTPPVVAGAIAFIVLDLLDYTYHYTVHRVRAFWRFHLVHHTDAVIDVSTTVREHPGETFVRTCFLITWVFVLGASVEILLLRQTTETVSNILSHTKYRLPASVDRVLGWIFITPNLHHAHHHFKLPATNCNYGDIFSVWDRLFGTFSGLSGTDVVFGLDTHMDERANGDFLSILAMPFAFGRPALPNAGQCMPALAAPVSAPNQFFPQRYRLSVPLFGGLAICEAERVSPSG